MVSFSTFRFKTTVIPISLGTSTRSSTISPPRSSSNITILNNNARSEDAAVITTVKPAVPQSQKQSPPPHSIKAAPRAVLNWAGEFIDTFIDPPLRPSFDPRHVLSSNFAPVDELPPTECEVVEGSLPSCLDGVYIRNGPNPQHPPRGPYHLFDGDGMLHAVRISGGKATFCSRYVKTYKFQVEREIGCPVIPNFISGFNGLTAMAARGALSAARTLSGEYDPANGIGTANTSLAHFGGKLFALGESDLPYAVRITSDGDIVTEGRHDFGGKMKTNTTAHPKIDPATGEGFAFRYGMGPPYLTFFGVNAVGNKERDVLIPSVTRPSYMHDLAITERYAVC